MTTSRRRAVRVGPWTLGYLTIVSTAELIILVGDRWWW